MWLSCTVHDQPNEDSVDTSEVSVNKFETRIDMSIPCSGRLS